jgi:hypothetical protein
MGQVTQDDLRDDELNVVVGGLVVPSIIAVFIGPLSPSPPAKHWFNGG